MSSYCDPRELREHTNSACHLCADFVHVLNVNAKIIFSCVASVSARVRPESFALSPAFRAINRLEALATQSKTL